jgi:7-cyano-7-deazaguanine synthase
VEVAKNICKELSVKQTIIDISFLDKLVDSALTSMGDVNKEHPRIKGLPASFVPNRNQLFITLSHAYAQKIGAKNLVTGVCETDYSGYPDCRLDFIQSIEASTNLGSLADIKIHTPLMKIDKADTFKLAEDVGILDIVLNQSHTCYKGDHEHKHPWGYGCGECPSCKLRKRGYEEFMKRYYY